MRPVLIAALALACSAQATAATFVVTRFDDPAPGKCLPDDCSLREAVNAANARAGRDRVMLDRGTYVLTRIGDDDLHADRGEIWIQDDLDLIGHSPELTRIRWTSLFPKLRKDGVLTFWNSESGPMDARVANLTVSHGRGGNGGCVDFARSLSTFHMENVRVEQCHARFTGGGIHGNSVELRLSKVEVRDNTAKHDGGGIAMTYDALLEADRLLVADNTADRHGGGLYFVQVFPTAPSVAFFIAKGEVRVTGNAANGSGGGIARYGDVELSIFGDGKLTVSNNTAGGHGGGLWHSEPYFALIPINMLIWDITVSGNSAYAGGGIAAHRHLQLQGVDVQYNSTTGGNGGGLYMAGTEGSASVLQSSFTGNSATFGGGINARCHSVDLSNVSLQGNHAAHGQAAWLPGTAHLTHVTVDAHAGSALSFPYDTLCAGINQFAKITNSLVLGTCATGHGAVHSGGGNQYGPAAAGCPQLPGQDQLQASNAVFGLSIDHFGGRFKVLGWNDDGMQRPQRDFVTATATCAATDVRGRPRSDGACDAGAFEQQ